MAKKGLARNEMRGQADLMQGLQDVLGMLIAMHRVYHTNHWKSVGYAEHLLFSDLYKGLEPEIDTIAEKIVGIFHAEAVALRTIQDRTNQYVVEWAHISRPYDLATIMEEPFQEQLVAVSKFELPLGLENFLQGIADAHEKNIYLLGRAAQVR